MALNLARLYAIARGEIDTATGVTGVAALQPEFVTPQKARCNASNVCNVSKTVKVKNDKNGRYDGRYNSALALPDDPDAGQVEADRRNRDAIAAGWTDRFCACGVMATVAIFDPSPKRGNRLWQCVECFEAGRAQVAGGVKSENDYETGN